MQENLTKQVEVSFQLLLDDISFRPSAALINFQVAANHIVAATVKNTLIRFVPVPPVKVTEIEISRSSDDRVHNLFLDPAGWHMIISMQSGVNFYSNWGMKKVRQLTKAKDLLIDSVAWNAHNTNESSTQEILIGTNDGLIFETILTGDEGRFLSNTVEQYWRQVANLGNSVTGLEIIRHPPGSTAVLVGELQRCVVFATTPSRMHQFAGWINTTGAAAGSTLLSHLTSSSPPQSSTAAPISSSTVTDNYPQVGTGSNANSGGLFPLNVPGLFHGVFTPDDKLPAGSKITEFPQNFGYSDLKLYQPPGAELPTSFAWMIGPGIYFGQLNTEQLSLPPFFPGGPVDHHHRPNEVLSPTGTPRLQTAVIPSTEREKESMDSAGKPSDVFCGRGVNLARNTKLIPYPVIRQLEHTSAPLAISLSEFHVVVLYADRVKAMNVLDVRTICSMPIGTAFGSGSALGLGRDPQTGMVWLFGNQGLSRLTVRNEGCRIWQIYLDRKQYEEARKFCTTESQLDTVNLREAEQCFNEGDFMNSAKLYARTSAPFEEVALRFSQLSLRPHAPLSVSPPVLRGVAVTDDHDVMNAIVHGVEGGDAEQVHVFSQPRSRMQTTVEASAPLKALVSAKLHYLIEHKTLPLTGNAAMPTGASALDGAPTGQIALLALWLAELLLTEIAFLSDGAHGVDEKADVKRRLVTVRSEFRQLMKQPPVLAVLPDTKVLLYELLDSHGIDEETVFLAKLIGDHAKLVDHFVRLGKYREALKTMAAYPTCLARMYEHAVYFVQHCPEEAVSTWLQLGKRLDPIKYADRRIISRGYIINK